MHCEQEEPEKPVAQELQIEPSELQVKQFGIANLQALQEIGLLLN